MIALSDMPVEWIKCEPNSRWLDGAVYWVSIRCVDDEARGVGIMSGSPERPVVMVKGLDVSDGRDYVVTHYCPVIVNWPRPAQ